MTDASDASSSSLSDAQRQQIRQICRTHACEPASIELESGILILSPGHDSVPPDADQARSLAEDLKTLGFDFVTMASPDNAETSTPRDPR
jgi:hypothetical protein